MDAPLQTPPNLPLSLNTENFQQTVQPSPYKPAESLLLGGTGEPSLLMGDLSASFIPDTSSQQASMFADFNIPELLMDDFFTFNPSAMHHITQQQQHLQQQPQPQQQQTPQELQEQSGVLEDAKSSLDSLVSGSNKSKKRHKRPRNSFNELQKKILDDFFDYQSHTPTRAQKLLLANKVNSNERTVTVWFQNRRQKLVKLARGEDVSSPGETKPALLKTHKHVSGGVSKKTKKSHYLSPPMQPVEAPAMGTGFGASPSTPFIMMPNTPTNPNMYAMFNGSFDASRYMLSPVTPTFNTYAMLQQMRNMQLTTPSPPPQQQPQDMFMDFQNNPLMFHPNPSPDQFLNFPQTYLHNNSNNNNNNPALPQIMQDPLLLSKTSFAMQPQNVSLPIDSSLANLTAASLQDKVKNSTSI